MLSGLHLKVEEAKIFGASAVVFRLGRISSRGPQLAVKLYIEYGDGVMRLEATPSVGIDGSGTGNRIFRLKELLGVLSSADCLVFEVDDIPSSNSGVFVRAVQAIKSRFRK